MTAKRMLTGAMTLLLVAACGGSTETTPSTTLAPATTTTAAAATTTVAPSTATTVAELDCQGFGEAMNAIAQSFLYQTFDGGAAFERQQGPQLAASLTVVSETIGGLRDQVTDLGDPLPGYEGAVDLMLQAIDLDEVGYADAAAAAAAGDATALDTAVAQVDQAFGILMSANVALSEAQACAG
jgi:hypothetical protein